MPYRIRMKPAGGRSPAGAEFTMRSWRRSNAPVCQSRIGSAGAPQRDPARRGRGAKPRARECESIPHDLPISFWECGVDSLHDSLKTKRCWCDSNRSHHSRKRRVRRRSHKPTFPVQLGILLPILSERSLEVRHSAWDRDHPCATERSDQGRPAGRAQGAEQTEPIPRSFEAPPTARAPAQLQRRKIRRRVTSAPPAPISRALRSGSVRGERPKLF